MKLKLNAEKLMSLDVDYQDLVKGGMPWLTNRPHSFSCNGYDTCRVDSAAPSGQCATALCRK